jgi:DNA repair protein RecO (recombination protein O)
MPGLYRDQGVVLRTIKLGEADRIVTIYTQAHGKVRGVAKGIRRTQSKFGARLEPASHVAVQLYKGRELDVITQCETVEANRALREGYGLLTHAIPMLEAVDKIAEDREPNADLYRMLSGALRTLAQRLNPLVTSAFFWKLLALEGYSPMLDHCARCGEIGLEPSGARAQASGGGLDLVSFDLDEGGMLCGSCAMGGGRAVSAPALELLRAILGGGLNDALAQAPGPVTQEVERLALGAIEHRLERRLRSALLL